MAVTAVISIFVMKLFYNGRHRLRERAACVSREAG
jgi:hypothetical protein